MFIIKKFRIGPIAGPKSSLFVLDIQRRANTAYRGSGLDEIS